jgi:scyllo-inositol 2-dehydrogenase (NADP+)
VDVLELTAVTREIAKRTASLIRVGLIGYGMAGSVFHAPLIQSTARLQLAAIARRSAAPIAGLQQVRVVAGADALLADPDIDLVVIATPNHEHAPLARSALRAGKHVVIDKPFALALAEADELCALAERERRLLSVFHNRRWDNGFRTAQQVLAQDTLGTIAYAELRFDRFRPRLKGGWREQPQPGAGVLFDLAPHLIDQALCLFGLPRAVTADVIAQREQSVVDDYFHLQLDYGRLRVLLHASVLVREPGPRLTLHGSRGSFLQYGADPQEEALKAGLRPGDTLWGHSPECRALLVDAGGVQRALDLLPGCYEVYYEGIAAALLDGAPPPVSAAQARDVMLVLDAAVRSNAERRTISLVAAKDG